MFTRQRRVRQLELCNRDMFGDLILTCQSSPFPIISQEPYNIRPPEKVQKVHATTMDGMEKSSPENEKRRASILVDQLLMDIYTNANNPTDYNSTTSSRSQKSLQIEASYLEDKDVDELLSIIGCLEDHVVRIGSSLVRQLKRRDALRRQRDAHCDVITNHLRKRAPENTDMRFTIQPAPGDSGFSQWASAMKMVSQLPGGIPPEFRCRLWLTLAEKHLASKGVDWSRVERNCFSEWSHPADAELGVQIVKDLHRTGCSLFCGEDGQENQALLKRVLLAYARWNKAVGYCQGFNMLAALILQVTDKNEAEALKIMIYLIEGVLPESYFADSLRGLSVDMAVFRELLRSKLPHLSRHLDALQAAAKEGTTSYEPPLTNVFTMQWFLTLFCNCLPQPTVLRVWDLIFLEGNEMLLRTALAIWKVLADRIMLVKSADEFYCIMGVLTRELLEFSLVDANSLIKGVVTIGPLVELKSLRDHYLYNINPWGSSVSSISEQEKQLKLYPRERLVLDISALKQQYAKLKQRQRQAHIIFNAAVTRHPPRATPVAMNHLLLGKSALVPAKRIGPPKGSIPPARQPPSTLHWKDTPQSAASSSSSSDTELCDEPGEPSSDDEESSKNSQFPIDNPTTLGDKTSLMTEDNTNCENISATVDNQSATVVTDSLDFISVEEDFDKTRQTNLSDCLVEVNQDVTALSDNSKNVLESASSELYYDFTTTEQTEAAIEIDDGGFDFEKFLEERVRCLKNSSINDGNDERDEISNELKRVESGRRNSQRALQIMQENSLILHRILQCQARLTPSPPPIEQESPCCSAEISDNAISLLGVEQDSLLTDLSTASTQNLINTSPLVEVKEADLEPYDYNSDAFRTNYNICENDNSVSGIYKACRIEESHSIDDFKESVIIESNNATEEEDTKTVNIIFEKNTTEEESDDTQPVSKYSSILEYSKNLNEKYNNLILNSSISNIKNKSFDSTSEPPVEIFSPASGSSSGDESAQKQEENQNPKSPSKVFNPFPVKMSSRQNKDVAVRLGLYKK